MKNILLILAVCIVSTACVSRGNIEPLSLSSAATARMGIDQEAGKDIPLDAIIASLADMPRSEQRSLAVIALLNNSDAACERYMVKTIKSSNYLSSGLGVTNLALSAAGSVATPVRSANILSGLATFSSNTRSELTSSVLNGKQPGLIYKSVMTVRREERSRIIGLLNESSIVAAAELADYHGKCGLTVGINGLEAAVDNASANADGKGTAAASKTLGLLRDVKEDADAPADKGLKNLNF